MKRSEMISKIQKYLDEWDKDSFQYNSHREEIILARSEFLLDLLEKAGMTPPIATFEDPGHFPGDKFKYTLDEWEPEDEDYLLAKENENKKGYR